jgi:hypothetical protein
MNGQKSVYFMFPIEFLINYYFYGDIFRRCQTGHGFGICVADAKPCTSVHLRLIRASVIHIRASVITAAK